MVGITTEVPHRSHYRMGPWLRLSLALLWTSFACAVTKPHVVVFGKVTSAKFFANAEETLPLDLKVRGLYVDGKLREFTTGPAHEITDRFFSVRRVFRVNDLLPAENVAQPLWQWQRGGWLLVDRLSGHISAIVLPEFDAYTSIVNWYRDYAAYCGVAESTKKFEVIVVQIARRKPLLKKNIEVAEGDAAWCTSLTWQRHPPRVTFELAPGKSVSYAIHGQAADLVAEDDDSSED